MLDSKSVYLGLNLARIATDYKKNNNLQNEHIAKMAKFSRGFYILFSLFNMVVWKLFTAQTFKCSSNCVAQ